MATIQERVSELYKDGYTNRRAIISEYYARYKEFPNEATVSRYLDVITRPTRAKAIFVRLYIVRALAIVTLLLIIGAIIGTHYKMKEVDRNMSVMYPTVKVSIFDK